MALDPATVSAIASVAVSILKKHGWNDGLTGPYGSSKYFSKYWIKSNKYILVETKESELFPKGEILQLEKTVSAGNIFDRIEKAEKVVKATDKELDEILLQKKNEIQTESQMGLGSFLGDAIGWVSDNKEAIENTWGVVKTVSGKGGSGAPALQVGGTTGMPSGNGTGSEWYKNPVVIIGAVVVAVFFFFGSKLKRLFR